MILLKILAKIIFLPFYLISLFTSIMIWLGVLAYNADDTLEEIMGTMGISKYWKL